jgi:hypothetical protein
MKLETLKEFAERVFGKNFNDTHPEHKDIIKQETLKFKNRQIGATGFVSNKIVENMISKLKQESIEEASQRAVKSGLFKDETLFIAGCKWQKEQDNNNYSKEEVLEHLNSLNTMPSSELDKFTNNKGLITLKWFKQFQKEQDKTMYGEEEVIELLEHVRQNYYDTGKCWHKEPNTDLTSKEILVIFKNK